MVTCLIIPGVECECCCMGELMLIDTNVGIVCPATKTVMVFLQCSLVDVGSLMYITVEGRELSPPGIVLLVPTDLHV